MVTQTSSAFVFRLYCPQASYVNVCGDFNCWSPAATPMYRTRGGFWEARLQLEPGEYRFRYLVDGSQWLTDYSCGHVVPNCHASWDSLAVVKVKPEITLRRRQTAAPAHRDLVTAH